MADPASTTLDNGPSSHAPLFTKLAPCWTRQSRSNRRTTCDGVTSWRAHSASKAFCDCHEMLQPGGFMVANPHDGRRQHHRHLARIRCSFDGAVLVADDSEPSNSIVFACKGMALSSARAGVVRRPRGLDHAGCEQLLGGFAWINRALRDRDEP